VSKCLHVNRRVAHPHTPTNVCTPPNRRAIASQHAYECIMSHFLMSRVLADKSRFHMHAHVHARALSLFSGYQLKKCTPSSSRVPYMYVYMYLYIYIYISLSLSLFLSFSLSIRIYRYIANPSVPLPRRSLTHTGPAHMM